MVGAGAAGRVFVALDGMGLPAALELVRALAPLGVRFKVGLELFCAAGPGGLAAVQEAGGPCFLDLKLHDIPRTVERAVRALAATGAWGITVHAAGGAAMLRAAVQAAAPLRCLAVTVLTSLDGDALRAVGVGTTPEAQVARLSGLARDAGCDGVVCSPREARAVRDLLGAAALIVTPGVRSAGTPRDDQARVATAREALAAGADAVVAGRSVTASPDPRAALLALLADLGGLAPGARVG